MILNHTCLRVSYDSSLELPSSWVFPPLLLAVTAPALYSYKREANIESEHRKKYGETKMIYTEVEPIITPEAAHPLGELIYLL